MNTILEGIPVVYKDPFDGHIELMPVEMIAAYVPFASYLNLEEAAKVAAIRDDEAATNLLLSIEKPYSVSFSESCGFDRLDVPFPY